MSGSVGTWGTRHAQAMLGALGRLSRKPLATGFTVLVIALALALPAALWVLVTNARSAVGGFASSIELTVYLKSDVALEKAQQLAAAARQRPDVDTVSLVSADEGLAEFREFSGFGDALNALEGNPLPHVLRLRPAATAATATGVSALREYLGAWPEVESVRFDTAWVERLRAILDLLTGIVTVAALLLGLGVLAVIGNTIRLEIDARRAEIEVTKLVGGTDAFVRRPFLYSGALYGLFGAVLACLIITGATAYLAGPVGRLAVTYGQRFDLAGLGPQAAGLVLGSGLLLGLLGAWAAAGRHLRQIQPRA